MIVATLRLLLAEADRARVIASLTPLIGLTRPQPGCRACCLLTDFDEPGLNVAKPEISTK